MSFLSAALCECAAVVQAREAGCSCVARSFFKERD
jgi:hypothetical protein